MVDKVKIELTAHGQGKIFIDGVEVHGVTGFSMKCSAGGTNELTISYMPHSIEIEGVAEITSIGDESRVFRQQ